MSQGVCVLLLAHCNNVFIDPPSACVPVSTLMR